MSVPRSPGIPYVPGVDPEEDVFVAHEGHLSDRRFDFDGCELCMLRYPDDYDYSDDWSVNE